MDWEYILSLGARNSILPLLYWRLREAGAPMPAQAAETLESHFRQNTLRNLGLTGELIQILAGLEERGIRAMPLRGPVLASLGF